MRVPNLLACLIAAVAAPGMAGAQALLGSNCGALTQLGGQQQTIPLNQPASAGQWVAVSVAVNNTFVQFAANSAVTDSAGNTYPVYGTVAMAGSSGILTTFAGRAANPLAPGSSITVNYTTSGTATAQACVAATAFPAVLLLSDPSDAVGENFNSGTNLGVTAATLTRYASELVYSVFASAASPGAISALSPAHGFAQTCSADSTLCLLPAWNLGEPMAGIYEGADAQSANSVPWGALLITFQSNDRIFANGFE